MAQNRHGVLDQLVNHADAVAASIDQHLETLCAAFRRAFAGSASAPVFEEVWASLSATNEFEFESLDNLEKYFTNYLKYFEDHIQDCCDNHSIPRGTIMPNRYNMLKAAVHVYHEIKKYRYLVTAFRDDTPEAFVADITNTLKATESAENELCFVDKIEVQNSITALQAFTVLIIRLLAVKGYSQRAVSQEQLAETNDDAPEWMMLKLSLESMPSIADLNENIDSYHSAEDGSRLKQTARSMLQQQAEQLHKLHSKLLAAGEGLRQHNDTLNRIISIEGKAGNSLACLRSFESIIKRYNDALVIAGFDVTNRYEKVRYQAFNKTMSDAVAECGRQSTAEKVTVGLYSSEWKNLASVLDQIRKDLILQFGVMANPYVEQSAKINTLYKCIHAVRERQRDIDHQRTQLAALLAKADGVINEAIDKIKVTIATLNDHTETMTSYVGDFVRRHYRELLLGAGTGSGVSTLAAGLAMTQPHLVAMAGIGALVGSGAGVGVGLTRDHLLSQLPDEKKPREINILDGVNLPGGQSASSSTPRWYSPVRFFKRSANSQVVRENDTMGERISPK